MITPLLFTPATKLLWDKLTRNEQTQSPFMSYEWHETWIKTAGKYHQPLYLLISDKIIAPLAIKDSIVELVGYQISDYCDLIGADDEKGAAWAEIIEYLKSHNLTELMLRNIPQNSSSLPYLRNINNLTVTELESAPLLDLPDSFENYLTSLSKDHRKRLKHNLKAFEEAYSEIIIRQDNSQQAIDTFIELMQKNPNKETFLKPEREEFFRAIAANITIKPVLSLVSVKGIDVAANLSFYADNQAFFYNSGFDRETYPLAGYYLRAMLIKRAIELKLTKIHFLRGNEPYKYRLGAKDFWVFAAQGKLNGSNKQ